MVSQRGQLLLLQQRMSRRFLARRTRMPCLMPSTSTPCTRNSSQNWDRCCRLSALTTHHTPEKHGMRTASYCHVLQLSSPASSTHVTAKSVKVCHLFITT